ncbi:MAG: GNAT family N-acetyltransferase [Bacteroidetes bacterium]|nr:MAG: GNAT family N-acetyltransferase [Bacteroidota bacterium]
MRSEHLQLRALEPNDIDILYQWENDTNIWHLSDTITPFSRFALEQYILNAGDDIFTARQLRMMIDLHKEEPVKTIGCVDIFDFDPVNLRAGIGIMIIEPERGKGYAAESLDLILDYAFNLLRLHQLYSNVIASNKASLELFKKKQFSVIGVKKEWLRSGNSWSDEYILQLINTN